jgi:hypothetical protein
MRNSCGDNGLLSSLSRTPGNCFLYYHACFFLLASLLGLTPAHAASADDQYLSVLKVIQQADTLTTSGNNRTALTKYRQALTALNVFQHNNPEWNNKIVSYRLNYLSSKIDRLTTNVTATAATNAAVMNLEKSVESGIAAPEAGAAVKVLEPGTEPRQALRLRPKVGDKQSLSMTLKTSVATKMGEMEMPAMKMPGITFAIDATVREVAAGGDIAYEMVVGEGSIGDEAGSLPQVTQVLKSVISSMKGVTGTSAVSSRGLSKEINFKAPAGADPQAKQMIEQVKQMLSSLIVPLPAEPVGQGAKWEFKLPVKTQGMTMQQTFEYQLVSMDGDRLALHTTISQSAEKQKIENPAMPGLKMDLDKMSGSGKGEVTTDLSQLLPNKGSADIHSEMSMGMDVGGQKQLLSTSIDINFGFESK